MRMAEWVQHIRDQPGSGKSIKAWCAANDCGRGQFYYWLRIVRKTAIEGIEAAGQSTALVKIALEELPLSVPELATESEETGIVIRYGNSCALPGTRLTICTGCTLKQNIMITMLTMNCMVTPRVPIFISTSKMRKVIYTTNAIESLNSGYRRLNRQRSVFPSSSSLLKALYLATAELTKKWSLPLRNWGRVHAELSIMYPGRLT